MTAWRLMDSTAVGSPDLSVDLSGGGKGHWILGGGNVHWVDLSGRGVRVTGSGRR